jgi:GNAT superfamily N-acetyltransferase
VSPAHRGTGVLAGLVDAVAAWSRAHGRPMLELDVVTTNGRAARAYAKLGFQNTGGPIAHPTIGPFREQRMKRAS